MTEKLILKDIHLYTDDELIGELKSRYEHFIFGGQRTKDKGYEITTMTDFKGNFSICAGLCSELQYVINKENDDTGKNIREK